MPDPDYNKKIEYKLRVKMDRCPVCHAKYNNAKTCRRCKANLEPLLDLEKKAEILNKKAVMAYKDGNFTKMFIHAKGSVSIYYTIESAKLLACAAVLINRMDLAIFLWKKIKL